MASNNVEKKEESNVKQNVKTSSQIQFELEHLWDELTPFVKHRLLSFHHQDERQLPESNAYTKFAEKLWVSLSNIKQKLEEIMTSRPKLCDKQYTNDVNHFIIDEGKWIQRLETFTNELKME